MIEFACPECRTGMTAGAAHAGLPSFCPACQSPVQIPGSAPRRPAPFHTSPHPATSGGRQGSGAVALTYGILSLFVPLFAPAALSWSNRALREDPTDGAAKAGNALGIIGTVLLVMAASAFFIWALWALSAATSPAPPPPPRMPATQPY